MIGKIESVVTVEKKNLFSVSKGNFPNHLIKALEARKNWR